MNNANVFIDVDLTLVDHNQRLMPGAQEGLQKLIDKGCHLFLWSTAGIPHAKAMAMEHKLEHFFEGYAAKPDIIIDDNPASVLEPFVFNPSQEDSWQSMAESIIDKHID